MSLFHALKGNKTPDYIETSFKFKIYQIIYQKLTKNYCKMIF